jgi:methyl-accepting chemotaxis protein
MAEKVKQRGSKGFGVRSKLMASILIATMLPTLIIGYLAYSYTKSALTDAGMREMNNIANNTYDMAVALNEEVKQGKITKEEAQSQMGTLLVGPKKADGTRDLPKSNVKLGETGYIFAEDSKGVLTMHPKLEGKSIWDVQNGVGKLIADTKNGQVRYGWINPGESASRDKIVVLKYFADWDWILAVGSYEEEFYQQANDIKQHLYVILGVEFVIGLVYSLFLAHLMTSPMRRMGHLMSQLGQGNLMERSPDDKRGDEYGMLARHYNTAVDNLSELIRKVTETSLQVAASSEQVTASAEQTSHASEYIAITMGEVAAGSEHQLTAVGDATHAMRDISRSVEEIASGVQAVNLASGEATQVAEQGGHVVGTTVEQMTLIDQKVTASSDVMGLLHSKTTQIGEIITLINSIARQTNLLALNAAIEAARAGEHGRGFSVVADEVRKLAEQSGAAAQQTANLITEIQSEMSRAADAMGEGSKAVHDGLALIRQTGTSFESILQAVEEVSRQVEDVTAAVEHVNASTAMMVTTIEGVAEVSDQMNHSTQNVSASIQQTNASMQEIASSTMLLAELADDLKESVGTFQI